MDPAKLIAREPKKCKGAVPRGGTPVHVQAETSLAKATGGKRVKGSGSGVPAARAGRRIEKIGCKGDVLSDEALFESKSTEGLSIRVTVDLLTKITREAEANMRPPGFHLYFPVMPEGVSNGWIMVTEAHWEAIRRRLRAEDE